MHQQDKLQPVTVSQQRSQGTATICCSSTALEILSQPKRAYACLLVVDEECLGTQVMKV